MVQWFNWTTFDIIGDLAFGESFGCLENMHVHPWIEHIFGNVKSAIWMAAIRYFGLSPLLRYLMPKRLLQQRMENFRFVSEKVDQRISFGTGRGDLLDNVIEHKSDEHGLTVDEIKSNASNFVVAGSETTATLLSGTTYYLLTNPRVLKKVVEEIRTSFQSSGDINIATVSRLKYMLAVLQESLRIFPPVPACR